MQQEPSRAGEVVAGGVALFRLFLFLTLAGGLWVFWGKPEPEAIAGDVVNFFATIWRAILA